MTEPVRTGLMLDTRPLTKAAKVIIDDTLTRAASASSPIQFIGIHPVFTTETRIYRGEDRDWVLAPIALDPIYQDFGGRLPLPEASLEAIRRLDQAGLDFPALYLAHDVPIGAVEAAATRSTGSELVPLRGRTLITNRLAREVVARPAPPASTVQLSRRFGAVSRGVMRAAAIAGLAVGGAVAVAAAPLFLGVGVAAAVGSDPILFGAVPLADSLEEGAPAAWYVLAAWQYE